MDLERIQLAALLHNSGGIIVNIISGGKNEY